MPNIGNYDNVVNAQNVLFYKGTIADEYITLTDIRITDETPIDRTHPRGGALDTPSFSLIEIDAEVTLDKAVYADFRAMRQLTSRGALPTSPYVIVAQSPAGASEDWTETGTFIVRRMNPVAPERGRYTTRVTLRLNNNNALELT